MLVGIATSGSNRTFMELKSQEGIGSREGRDVLIAPLWN